MLWENMWQGRRSSEKAERIFQKKLQKKISEEKKNGCISKIDFSGSFSGDVINCKKETLQNRKIRRDDDVPDRI